MRKDKVKVLKTTAMIILIVSIALALVATIMMFSDITEMKVDFYEGGQHHPGAVSTPRPQSGVLPLIGLVLLLAALLCLHLSKKSPEAAIGTLVLNAAGLSVLISTIVDPGYGANGTIGCFLAVAGGSLSFFSFCVLLAAVIVQSIRRKTPVIKAAGGPSSTSKQKRTVATAQSLHKAAALLRDLKRLLDAGAITQAEYEDEKDRILLRYGISIPRAGAKAEKENVFEEFDDE